MADDRLRVCLERVVELDGVRLRLQDWPGLSGVLVHVPDPVSPNDEIVAAMAFAFAPRHRVMSLSPRGNAPYQVDATDLVGTLDQFGFEAPTLIGERLGCVVALLVAAWYPDRVGRLILIDPTYAAPTTDGIAARALRECTPHWSTLQSAVKCPVLSVSWSDLALGEIEDFLRNEPPATRRTSRPSSPPRRSG